MDAFRKLYHDVEGTTDNKHIGNNFRRPIQPLNERTVYRSYETLGLFCTFCLVTLISLIRTADTDATRLSSWVASVVCTEFTTGWRQSRRVWTNLPAAKSSCVGSLEPVYNFLCCWATCIKVGDKWRHNWKVINIDQNSRSQTAYGVCLVICQIVDQIRRQSSWATCSCEICSHRRRRQLSRVGDVYWAIHYTHYCLRDAHWERFAESTGGPDQDSVLRWIAFMHCSLLNVF